MIVSIRNLWTATQFLLLLESNRCVVVVTTLYTSSFSSRNLEQQLFWRHYFWPFNFIQFYLDCLRQNPKSVCSKLREKQMACTTVVPVGGEVNPIVFKLNLPWWIILRSIVFGFVLVPLRVVILLVLGSIGWLYATCGTSKCCSDDTKPMSTFQVKFFSTLFKLIAWTVGFWVSTSGKIDEEAQILTLAPHPGFFDSLLFGWMSMPCVVVAKRFKGLPFIGKWTTKRSDKSNVWKHIHRKKYWLSSKICTLSNPPSYKDIIVVATFRIFYLQFVPKKLLNFFKILRNVLFQSLLY